MEDVEVVEESVDNLENSIQQDEEDGIDTVTGEDVKQDDGDTGEKDAENKIKEEGGIENGGIKKNDDGDDDDDDDDKMEARDDVGKEEGSEDVGRGQTGEEISEGGETFNVVDDQVQESSITTIEMRTEDQVESALLNEVDEPNDGGVETDGEARESIQEISGDVEAALEIVAEENKVVENYENQSVVDQEQKMMSLSSEREGKIEKDIDTESFVEMKDEVGENFVNDEQQNLVIGEDDDVKGESDYFSSAIPQVSDLDEYSDAPKAIKSATESNQRPSKTTRFSYVDTWKEHPSEPLPPLVTNNFYNQKPRWRPHEWIYKPAPRYVRDVITGCRGECQNQHLPNRYAGPCRKKSRESRNWLKNKCMEERDVNWLRANPAITVPMRAHPWKRRTWLPPPKSGGEEWVIKAERDQARKEHIQAQKLGYETLVGNIVYIDIPGARDLNRSWKHFLDRNPMAWGFPYNTGTSERPSLPLPSPYLVHQLKESLWKYPKNKFLHSSND